MHNIQLQEIGSFFPTEPIISMSPVPLKVIMTTKNQNTSNMYHGRSVTSMLSTHTLRIKGKR
jgi:hypothetical protein